MKKKIMLMLLAVLGMFFLNSCVKVVAAKKSDDCTLWKGKCVNAKIYMQIGGNSCLPYIIKHCKITKNNLNHLKGQSKKQNKSEHWGYDDRNMPPCNSGYKAVKINPSYGKSVWVAWESCVKKYYCKKKYLDFGEFRYYYERANESERHRPGWECRPE